MSARTYTKWVLIAERLIEWLMRECDLSAHSKQHFKCLPSDGGALMRIIVHDERTQAALRREFGGGKEDGTEWSCLVEPVWPEDIESIDQVQADRLVKFKPRTFDEIRKRFEARRRAPTLSLEQRVAELEQWRLQQEGGER